MAGAFRPAELARYADAIVGAALDTRAGDVLIVNAEPGHRELAIGVVEAAYRARAKHAEVQFVDPQVQAAQLRGAADEWLGWVPPWAERQLRIRERDEYAVLYFLGETESAALAGIPAERVAQARGALHRQLTWAGQPARELRRRLATVACPTVPWAQRVYPGVKPERALRRLGRDLLHFCRVGPDDPPGWTGLREQLDEVEARAKRLTRLRLRRLELRGPGTDLTLGLAADAIFEGAYDRNAHGRRFAANVPTEEVYTSPDPRATDGVFRCSRPRLLGGRLLEGVHGEFRGGRLVRVDGEDASGEYLRSYLGAARNADRLGEIALVDRSSRIGATRRIYYNPLIDENAVTHMAFGAGFPSTRPAEARGRGVNRSELHLDVMLGSDELEATGIRAGGGRVPLIRDGTWQL
jgi:aminopeptidase